MEQLRRIVLGAADVLVLTGSEVSAESGLPAFRSTRAAYEERPAEIWDWYAARREIVRALAPNAVHRALAAFGLRRAGRFCLVTQTVDDLQQRAGLQDTICLHGNIMQDAWLLPPRQCCESAVPGAGSPPRCATCGNLRRPAVTWVDEAPSAAAVEAAMAAARRANAMLVIGEAGQMAPAAELVAEARAAGHPVICISAAPSALERSCTHVQRGPLADLVPALLREP